MPTIAVIVCGAPLARRVTDIATCLKDNGMDALVVGTPSSKDWVDVNSAESALGYPPRFTFRAPSQTKADGDPDAVVIAPATFNSMNKLANGIADNYAVSLAASALGANLPMLIAPMVNGKLWGHPAWRGTLRQLSDCGVRFLNILDGSDGAAPTESGTGGQVVESFDPMWILRPLKNMI